MLCVPPYLPANLEVSLRAVDFVEQGRIWGYTLEGARLSFAPRIPCFMVTFLALDLNYSR